MTTISYNTNIAWLPIVIYAFFELYNESRKGYYHLEEINQKVSEIRTDLNQKKIKSLYQTISAVLETHSEDSDKYNGKLNIFQCYQKGEGLWSMNDKYHELCSLSLKLYNDSITDALNWLNKTITYKSKSNMG